MADTTTPDTFNARTLIAEALAPSAPTPQSNISPEFVQEAILQDRLGNEVTPEQNQIARDYDRLSYGAFAAKYGSSNLQAANTGKNTANNYWSNRALGNQTSLLSADALKSLGGGIVSAGLDTIQGAVGLLPNKSITEGTREGLSKASQYIRKAVEDSADVHTKAARDAYSIKQAADTRIAQRHFEEDIQSGIGENVATMRRLASEGSNAIHNALTTGQYAESASNTFGSVLPALLTGGIAAKGTGYLAEKAIQAATKVQGASLLGKAASVVANVNPVKVEAAKNLSAWAIANGLMEGGSASGQVLEQLKTDPKYSVENLLQNSPEYQERLQSYITEHPDVLNDTDKLLKAAEEVKNQFDFDIADSVGTKQGLSAAGLSPLSAGFMKWVTPGGLAKNKISSALADATKDALEEPLTEMSGQYQQNIGIKRADKNQDEWEGVGEAGGQALLGTGALGGTHIAGTAVARATSSAVQNASQAYQNHQEVTEAKEVAKEVPTVAEVLNEKEGEGLSGVLSKFDSTIKQVQNTLSKNEKGEISSGELSNTIQDLQQQVEQVKNTVIPENLDKSEKEQLEQTQQKVVDSLNQGIENINAALAQKANTAIEKILKDSAYKLADSERDDIVHLLNNQPIDSVDAVLNNLPENQVKNLSSSKVLSEQLQTTIKENLNNRQDISTNESSEVAQTAIKNSEPAESKDTSVTNLDSFVIQSSQGSQMVHTKMTSNGMQLQFGDTQIKMPKSLQSVFSKPEATFEEKAEALKNWYQKLDPENPVTVTEGSIRHAVDLLYSSKSSDALHGMKLLKAHKKVASLNPESGEIEVQDLATSDINQKVTSKLGSLGDKVQAVTRPFYLLTEDNPLVSISNLLKSKEAFDKYLSQIGSTNKKSLLRKAFKGDKPVDTNKSFLDKNDGLAGQILAILNPESEYSKTFLPVFEKAIEGNKELEGIFLQDGKIKPEHKQVVAVVGAHWLATVSAYRHPLNDDECRKYGIDPSLNQRLAQNAQVYGYLAPAAMMNLTTNLQKMMGVIAKDSVNPEEVAKPFAQLAGKIADAMIDSGILTVEKQFVREASYDQEKHTEKVTTREVEFLRVANKDLDHLFQESAGILDQILNPQMKNVVHYKPTEVNDTVVGTTAKISDKAREALKKANSIAHTINVPMAKFALALGASGITRLFSGTANGMEDRKFFTKDAWITRKGRELTNQTALDVLSTIIDNREDGTKVENIKVFFDNRAIVNGRIMQQGAATYQSSTLLRQALMVTDGKAVDLNNKDMLNAWKITLAQKLGQNVGGTHLASYEAQVDAAIDFAKTLPADVKKVFDKVQGLSLDSSEVSPLTNQEIDTLAQYIQKFNEDQKAKFGDKAYLITKPESFNALIEMNRYHTEDKSNFVPHIFLEIDGLSDGPAYINRLFGIAINAITPEFIQTLAETGFIPVLDTTSQDILTEGTKESKYFGTGGFNLHAKVGASLADSMFKRIQNLQETIKTTRSDMDAKAAERVLKATKALMKLFSTLGLVSGDLAAFYKGKKDAIQFHKNISKKMSTIILYGSGLRGTTNQLVDMLFDGAYGKDGLNGKFSNILSNLDSRDQKNRQQYLNQYAEIREALVDLFSVQAEREFDWDSGTYSYKFTNDSPVLLTSKVTALPKILLNHFERIKTTKNGVIFASTENSEDLLGEAPKTAFLQNFELTETGREQLVDLLMPIFGEPVYASIVNAVGADALTAAKVPMMFGNIANAIARTAETYSFRNLKNQTQSKRFAARQRIQNHIQPNITFKGGARVLAERSQYIPEGEPLYKGKHSATTVYNSVEHLDDIGVAFGALVTQGLGDTSTAYHLLTATDGVFGQVFDGMYTAITKLAEVSQAANEGAKNASTQKPIKQIAQKIDSIGSYLQRTYPRYSKDASPKKAFSHAVADMVNGILPDGTKMNKEEQTLFRNSQYQLTRTLTQFERNVVFDPSIFKARETIFSNKQYTEVGIDTKIKYLVEHFFDMVDGMVLNEQINHEVMDHLPQTFHHMSGASTPFKFGKTLSSEDVGNLLKKVNNLTANKFENFAQLLSAYCATEANEIAQKLLDDKKITKEEFNKWQILTHRTEANTAVRTLDAESKALMDEAIGKEKHLDVPDHTPHITKNTQLPVSAINNAITSVGNQFKANSIFGNIFQKLQRILPRNIPVFMYENRDALPEDVRKYFDKDAQQGIFIEGKGIYIVSQNKNNVNNDLRNQEVIVHELLHAALSRKIQNWVDNPKSVPTATRIALENLEKLLNDLPGQIEAMAQVAPKIVEEFNKLLSIKDRAERIDESLAYILSNHELFNALAGVQLTNRQAKKHQGNLQKLFDKIREIATEAWKALLSIVTGSPMDQILDTDASKKHFEKYKDTRDFLTYYGVNTLVLLDNPKGKKPEPRKEDKVTEPTAIQKAFEEAQKAAKPIIRNSLKFSKNAELNLGITGYLKGKTELDTLAKRVYTDRAFENFPDSLENVPKWLRSLAPKGLKEATLDASKELETIQEYTKDLESVLQKVPGLKNPSEVASLAADFQKDTFFKPSQRKELTENYLNVVKDLDPYFLIKDKNAATQEEQEYSVKMYSILTGSDPVTREEVSAQRPKTFVKDATKSLVFQKPALFYAIAYTNPEINEALGKVSVGPEKAIPEAPKGTFSRFMESSGNLILNALNDQKVQAANTSQLVQDAYRASVNEAETLGDTVNKMLETLTNPLDQGLVIAALSPGLLSRLKLSDLKETAKVVTSTPVTLHNTLGEIARNATNTFLPIGLIEWVRDAYGRVPSNTSVQTLLKSIKGFIDKNRKFLLDTLPKELINNFNRKLKLQDKKFLHRTLATTSVVYLDYSLAQNVLTDTQKLLSKIQEVENKILNQNKTLGNTYLAKARQLANYTMGDGKPGVNLLTNPEAIAYLWDEVDAPLYNLDKERVSETLIADIRNLVILYNLQYLTEGDRKELSNYFKNDSKGMERLFNSIKETLEAEHQRVQELRNSNWKYNARFGWFPKGAVPKGTYRLVPASKVQDYTSRGFKNLGKLKGSEIEGEPVYRMYDSWSNIKDAQEGIFQCINQTAFGWQVNKNAPGEIAGSTIYDKAIVNELSKRAQALGKDFGYIPIRNSQGKTIGYERAIPKADRVDYVDGSNDVFTGLAQYKARQERETLAKGIMLDAVKLLKEDYENAPDQVKKRQFEDIFNSKNKYIQRAVSRLDNKTKQRLLDTFDGNHCYIRKDEVWTYLGYYKMSIGDMWDGNFLFPKQMSQVLVKILDALVPNGKARAYLSRAESLLMGAATWSRETIIIRSGIVPLMNAIGNIFTLGFTLMIPPAEMWRLFKECYVDTEKYNRLRKQEMSLEAERLSTSDESKKLELTKKIEQIQLAYKNLPIYKLIEEGEYSTIDNNGTTYDSIELIKMKTNNWLEAITDEKIPANMKTFVKNALMTKDSDTFQALAKFTNYGDWLAKAVGYRYLTEHKKVPMQKDLARNVVSTLFVDYDQFVGPTRDWLNRIGLTWFMTFKMRMLAACQLSMLMNPSTMVLGTLFESEVGLPGTPLSDNIVSKLLGGNLGASLGFDSMYRAINLHPLAVVLGS